MIVGRPLVDVLDSTRFVTPGAVGRSAADAADRRRRDLGGDRPGARAGDRDPARGRRDHRDRAAPRVSRRTRRDEIGRLAATMNRMLDRLQRSQEQPAALRLRRVARIALADRGDPPARRGRAGSPGPHDRRRAGRHRARRGPADAAPGRRPAAARAGRRAADLQLPRYAGRPGRPAVRRGAAVAHGNDLDRSTPPAVSAGQVRGDEASLRRMIHNLGDNAARYARSRIAFALAESDGDVVLTVSDDGPGIPPADRDRVFERFVRLNSARSRETAGPDSAWRSSPRSSTVTTAASGSPPARPSRCASRAPPSNGERLSW